MSFLGEIKRRKVFQVAAVYIVVAWLIMQVVDVVSGPLLLPDIFARIVILVLAIGFPIAVILSWAFDLTPEGVVRDQGIKVAAPSSGRRIEYVLIGLLVIAMGWIGFREFNPAGPSAAGVLPNSVAVLPFDDMSANPEYAFFAPGMHDEILNQLAKLENLNVIARTSVMQYAGAARPITEIARELNVGTIMEGSVSYAEGRVAIRTQLIDAETGVHLWSDSYNRVFSDVFGIQADIAMNVANALAAEFSLAEQQEIEKAPTNSPEAYALYLRAMALWVNDTQIGSRTVRARIDSYLNQAIEADPDFALAYVQRAYLYLLELNSDPGTEESFTARRIDLEGRALRDLDRAMTLDPDLGDAYRIRARIHQYNWRGAEARAAYEQALELSPNNSGILMDYADFNATLGRYEDAFRFGQRAVELDPNSGSNHASLASIYSHAGDGPAAVAAARQAIELTPAYPNAHIDLGQYEAQLGNDAEALDQLRIAERLVEGNTNPVFQALIAYNYSLIDRTDDVVRLFRQLQEDSATRRIPHTAWIIAYLAIGDEESALEWMNTSADDPQYYEGHFGMAWLSGNGYHIPILDQPEFVEVRSRLGFRE